MEVVVVIIADLQRLGIWKEGGELRSSVSCDDGIYHFNIVISLLFFIFIMFLYILQIGIRERRPDQRY